MKNVHPVSAAGIRTRNLLNTSGIPLPVDQGQGSRPLNKGILFDGKIYCHKQSFIIRKAMRLLLAALI